MASISAPATGRAGAAIRRGVALLLLWIAIAGADFADLPVGLAAAALASWASLRLMPPTRRRVHPVALARLLLRLPWQALVAGIDVARRAFDPRLPVRPGLVPYATQLGAGHARDAFLTLSSLLPGTLPAGEPASEDANGRVLVHVLDPELLPAEGLAREEALFVQAFGPDG
jgi:multicomponent Na+:H+ antiporter subunit E